MAKTLKILVIIAAAIIIIVLTQLANQSNDAIKIGGIFSLTGNGAAYGEPSRNGALLAVEEINRNGGVNGRNIEIVLEDSKFDPKTALTAYQKLKAVRIRLFVSNGSAVSLALRKPIADSGDFQFETGAVTPLYSDGLPNTCRLTLTAPVAGESLGDFISSKLLMKSFAALTLNDDFGKSMADTVSDTVKLAGMTITGMETFDKNASDFRTHITKLAATKPDVLMIIPAAGQAQTLLKQLKELGWKGIIVSDHWTIVNDSLKDLSLAENVYFVNYAWSDEGNYFTAAYEARFRTKPPVIAANAYDSTILLARAIEAVGDSDPVAIGKWLTENTKDYRGVTGSVTMNSDCESSREAVIQQVKEGDFIKIQ